MTKKNVVILSLIGVGVLIVILALVFSSNFAKYDITMMINGRYETTAALAPLTIYSYRLVVEYDMQTHKFAVAKLHMDYDQNIEQHINNMKRYISDVAFDLRKRYLTTYTDYITHKGRLGIVYTGYSYIFYGLYEENNAYTISYYNKLTQKTVEVYNLGEE